MEVGPPKTVTAAVHYTNPGCASDFRDLYGYYKTPPADGSRGSFHFTQSRLRAGTVSPLKLLLADLKYLWTNRMNKQIWGFPGSSAGKESNCNARDPSLIPGWGRFLGEGIGYPHQYSWASLMAQLVKNPPAMRDRKSVV